MELISRDGKEIKESFISRSNPPIDKLIDDVANVARMAADGTAGAYSIQPLGSCDS